MKSLIIFVVYAILCFAVGFAAMESATASEQEKITTYNLGILCEGEKMFVIPQVHEHIVAKDFLIFKPLGRNAIYKLPLKGCDVTKVVLKDQKQGLNI